MKKFWMILMSFVFVYGLCQSVALAEDKAPERDCLPEEGFSRYFFVTPDQLMSDVETTQAVVTWNYQCAHEDNSVEVFDEQGELVRTVQTSGSFGKGENTTSWDGLNDQGKPAEDGVYTIRITPLDEFSQFAMEVKVKIRLMKYPAIYGIFGDELKEQVKQLP